MIFKKNESKNLNSTLSKIFFKLKTIKEVDEGLFVENFEENNNKKFYYQFFNQLKEKANKKFKGEISLKPNNKYDFISITILEFGEIFYNEDEEKIIFEGKISKQNDDFILNDLHIFNLFEFVDRFLINLNNMLNEDLEYLKKKLNISNK